MDRRLGTLLVMFALVPSLADAARPRHRARARAVARTHAEHGWELLGETKVGRSLDHDTVAVTRSEGVFKRLRLDVERAGVRIAELKVRYANGDVDSVPVREHVAAGGSTRVIDLEGSARVIREIELWYETRTGADEKAHVKVYGLHA
jgi:hypothetical protein